MRAREPRFVIEKDEFSRQFLSLSVVRVTIAASARTRKGAAPQLSRAAERLRAEHKELYLDLCELVERSERMFYDEQHAELALWLGREFLDFDARLRSHEERENELIMDAYDGDLGVGD